MRRLKRRPLGSRRWFTGWSERARSSLVATQLMLGLGVLLSFGCNEQKPKPGPAEAAPLMDASLDILPKPPAERKGMVWVPPGALIAGTPPGRFPRVADAEMPGEQLILKGFYMDIFPFPNEQGAIPLTNITQEEAEAHCAEQEKRLCTELEWERACKGPSNFQYEYGETYQQEKCNTGAASRMLPSGLLFGCRSEFGARDMHGGIWEWTSSPYGRGTSVDQPNLVSIRGGNSLEGEVVGRCANVAPRAPTQRAGTLGFRCCAGERNSAEVTLRVTRGPAFRPHDKLDPGLVRQFNALLPKEAEQDLGKLDGFKIQWLWSWWPIGNDELLVAGGCVGLATEPRCGALVGRSILGDIKLLAWVPSGHWAPTLQVDAEPKDLWLFGGDQAGSYRRLIGYLWGQVRLGEVERNLPKPKESSKRGAGAGSKKK